VASQKTDDALTIGLSFDSYVIERWTRDRDVFCATAGELGAEVNVQSANGEMETQISQIQYFIDIGVDAIVIVTIDADGQHNPDEIPSLIKPIIEDGADLVNGSRYMNGPEENTPAYRRVGQQVLDNATNISAGIKVTDSQSGFRAFSPAACKVFRFYDTGFGIESEMLVDVAEAGLKIVEVPITVRYDVDGSTKNPVTHGVGVLLKIIKDKIFRTFKK
jgi:glycosyltransferase involved in cell wall biosynthesis